MTTHDFITELFCPIDDLMKPQPLHPQASLYPSEVVTLGLLFGLKGVGNRAFYRWLVRDCRELFPQVPERTRLFRLLKTHWRWTYLFMARPTLLGVIDTYGIELLHPIREGRSHAQFARKGISNHRWIMGAKLGLLLNRFGLIVGWAWAPANTHDQAFQPLIEAVEDRLVVLGDTGFHAAEGNPSNFKLCRRGQWNTRMLVETVLSMLTGSVISRRSPIVSPPISRPGWLSLWPLLTCWLSGMGCLPMKMASCGFLSPAIPGHDLTF